MHISAETWAADETSDIKAFVRYWNRNHEERPELWVSAMTPAQWEIEFNRWRLKR